MTALQPRDAYSLDPDQPVRPGPVDLLIELRAGAHPSVEVTDATLRFHYDLHRVVSIGSVTPLPELEPLQCEPTPRPDLVVEEGQFGSGSRRSRPVVTQYAHVPIVSFEDDRGRRGSNFLIDMSDGVRVVAAPVLARSPLALYSHLVEALLRFLVVPHGYVLLRRGAGVALIDANGDPRPADGARPVCAEELIPPADDAYGFLPFRYVAPALVMGGAGYDELRDAERAILGQAGRALRARRPGRPRTSADPATPANSV